MPEGLNISGFERSRETWNSERWHQINSYVSQYLASFRSERGLGLYFNDWTVKKPKPVKNKGFGVIDRRFLEWSKRVEKYA